MIYTNYLICGNFAPVWTGKIHAVNSGNSEGFFTWHLKTTIIKIIYKIKTCQTTWQTFFINLNCPEKLNGFLIKIGGIWGELRRINTKHLTKHYKNIKIWFYLLALWFKSFLVGFINIALAQIMVKWLIKISLKSKSFKISVKIREDYHKSFYSFAVIFWHFLGINRLDWEMWKLNIFS